MNRFEQQLKKEAEHIRLSAAEKQAIRARLQEAMQPATASPSPFVFSFEFFSTARYAFAALLMIVFVGGGTVSAASSALPGDWLYAVKTEFNEQVELAWADTPDEEALVEARLAQRRVAEAEALEAEGRFDEELALEIEQRFDTHASRARALARGEADVAEGSAASRSLTFTIGAPSANEEGEEEPVALMATMVADEPAATTTLPMDAKLQAGAEVEVAVDEVIEDVEDTLEEHRERLERLRERLNARRDALEANATTTINYNNVRVQVEANGEAEITISEVDTEGAVVETVKEVTDSVEEAVDEVLPLRIKIGL